MEDNSTRMKYISILTFMTLFFFLFVGNIFAQESTSSSVPLSATPVTIEYSLPYPGLLPDSPLYFLKAARDRIISFFISDPLKKAEFNIFQADKRLNSGIFLFKQRKEDQGESTIAKGLNYLNEAVTKVGEAKKQGADVASIVEKFSLSLKKHREVIKMLQKKAKKDIKEKFTLQLKQIASLEKRLSSK